MRGRPPAVPPAVPPADPGAAPRADPGVEPRADPGAEPLRLPAHAELVLEAVEQIPPGSVLAYGDVAELVGSGGPRQVGAVMSRYGSQVAWWRVVRADGRPPSGHEQRALEHYRGEGTPMRSGTLDGVRVDMRAARWQP